VSATLQRAESAEDFLRYLREDCQYPWVQPLPDGWRYVALYPLMFTTAIIVGRLHDRIGYDRRWCYEDSRSALAAAQDWIAAGAEGEPTGWHREPSSGRRRWGGDPEKEYIDP
jgi:hypothetical protein